MRRSRSSVNVYGTQLEGGGSPFKLGPKPPLHRLNPALAWSTLCVQSSGRDGDGDRAVDSEMTQQNCSSSSSSRRRVIPHQ